MEHEQTTVKPRRERPVRRPAAVGPAAASPSRPWHGAGRPVRPSPATTRAKYWPGLDGMRGIAVVAVVMYHMEPNWLPGGYFGVDIFFVISGYLITSMLGAEWSSTGGINLRRFWLRRVRRLYPAVVTLLVVLIPVAAIVAPTALASMRTTIPAALLYLTNWWFIYHHVPYFQTFGRPPLLIHFWSLAIEEQYYLIWPPILAVLLARWRRPARIAAVALIGALISSILMAALYHPGADINRIYYGTDTHAQGLLLGSALGLVVAPSHLTSAVTVPARRLLDALGGSAIVGLVVIMIFAGQNGGFTWLGGMVLVVVLAGIAVVVAAHPASQMSGVLGAKPMRWLGTRSYSIYLWHWPILDLTRPHVDVDFGGFGLGVLRIALIVGAAELSYRYVERPWRTGRAQELVRALLARGRNQRQIAIVGAACVAIAVVALVITAPSPTPPPSLAIGETKAAKARITPVTTPPPSTAPGPSSAGTRRQTAPTYPRGVVGTVATTAPPTTTVPGAPAPIVKAPAGGPVLAIGDSVMVGASPDLSEAFGAAITVDAQVGRQVYVGLARLEEYKSTGHLKGLRALVIGLGTNGPFEPSQMRQLISLTRGIPEVVLINVRVPEPWQAESNKTIESVAHRPGFKVVNWYAASANSSLLYPDQIHPDIDGQAVYTNLIVKAVTGK